MSMLRTVAIIGLLPLLLLASPASALTKAQKMETCKFGADDQKVEGAKRKAFIANCMSDRNDKRGPAGKPVAKKPPAKKAADTRPADAAPPPPKQ
jgi:psiF repeat